MLALLAVPSFLPSFLPPFLRTFLLSFLFSCHYFIIPSFFIPFPPSSAPPAHLHISTPLLPFHLPPLLLPSIPSIPLLPSINHPFLAFTHPPLNHPLPIHTHTLLTPSLSLALALYLHLFLYLYIPLIYPAHLIHTYIHLLLYHIPTLPRSLHHLQRPDRLPTAFNSIEVKLQPWQSTMNQFNKWKRAKQQKSKKMIILMSTIFP